MSRRTLRRHLLDRTAEPVDDEALAAMRRDAEDWLDIWELSLANSGMRTDRDVALELASSMLRLCREVEQRAHDEWEAALGYAWHRLRQGGHEPGRGRHLAVDAQQLAGRRRARAGRTPTSFAVQSPGSPPSPRSNELTIASWRDEPEWPRNQ